MQVFKYKLRKYLFKPYFSKYRNSKEGHSSDFKNRERKTKTHRESITISERAGQD